MKRYRIFLLIVLLAIGIGFLNNMSANRQTGVDSVTTINISSSGLQHVIDRHTVGGTDNTNKSVFFNGQDIKQLIADAEKYSAVRQANGNLQRIVNARHNIGIDRTTGNPTSTYTVITDESNELITAFPGLP